MKGRKSYVLTFLIYGLMLYICIRLVSLGIDKCIPENILEGIVKNITKDNVLSVNYVMRNEKNIFDRKTGLVSMINRLTNIPVNKYSEEMIAVNVAENARISCIMNEKTTDEITNETRLEADDKTDGENVTDETQKESDISSENPTGEEKPDDVNASQDAISANVNKVKDIKTEELTYEYLMSNFYTVVSSTTLYPEDIDASKLMNMDMKMQGENNNPQILIYHTHGQEAFADSVSGDKNMTIVGVGDYLTKLLTEQYGYNVIHLSDSFDYVNGVFDRHKAYDYANERVTQVLADNPSIEVVIDLHRDGVADNLHLVTDINGKKTARIMFFNGISRLNSMGEIGYLYNPHREENLAFSLQMKVLAEEYFEGFTRKNYIQAYQYNLHLRGKSMLIEAGAQTNTFEEELNAMEPLAKLLDVQLSGE